MADLPSNLPPNRLRCSDCKAFRSITDFPFEDGFRKSTCTKCQFRRVNRLKVQEYRRQIRARKAEEKQRKDKEWRVETNKSDQELRLPLHCLGCWAYTCVCKVDLEKENQLDLQELQQDSTDLLIKYCSSCNQQRSDIEFGGSFWTCSFCRFTNTKALRRRNKRRPVTTKPQPQYLPPTLQQIESHLQTWVASRGEYELKLQKRQRWNCNSVLLGDKRRPLTVEDYLENSPTGISTGQGISMDQGISTDQDVLFTDGVARAEPGPQTELNLVIKA